MATGLSDMELVKAVRGSTSKRKFAGLLGVSRSVIPQYEQGLVRPHTDAWLKMARLVRDRYPLNVMCWERAGLDLRERTALIVALKIENEPRSEESRELLKAKELFSHSYPEPVTGGLDDTPTPEEDKFKSLDDYVKQCGPLPHMDWEATNKRLRELEEEVVRGSGMPPPEVEVSIQEYGIPPVDSKGGKGKSPATAKKTKRERRRKK